MSDRQLINGGVANSSNIYYWETSNVSIASDTITHYYKVASKGTMRQVSRIPVKGTVKVSCTYKCVSRDDTIIVNINAKFDDGTIESALINLQPSLIDEWYAFEHNITIPDNARMLEFEIIIRYPGVYYSAVANISAITYYRNVTGSVPYDDFIDKAILYGLDSDLPTLGITDEEGEDNG